MLGIMRGLSFIAFLFGLLMFFGAKSAIHEIEGLVCFLIGSIFLSSAFIVDAIQKPKEVKSNE